MYLPILTYHRLLSQDPAPNVDPKRISVSLDQFRSHLRWFKRLGYRSLRLADYVHSLQRDEPVPARSLAITFDDGYEEVFSLGLPALREFGFSATVFSVPGEESNRWDDGNARLMSSAELRGWLEAGMEVGAHTSHHVHLTQVDRESAKRELTESKQLLEKSTGRPITLMAYPYGESDDAVEALAKEAGYEAAFATDRAPQDHTGNLYRLRRPVIFPRNTPWEILMKVQRWYPAYQDWKRR
jgi:peptidoglycan/xylan/chitin deacetylase (PgdA/CDA1 family)